MYMYIFSPVISLGEVDVQCDTAATSKSLIACIPCSVAKERGLLTFEPKKLPRQGCNRNRKRALNLANSLKKSQVVHPELNDSSVNSRYDIQAFDINKLK